MVVFSRKNQEEIIVDLSKQGLGLVRVVMVDRRLGRIGIEAIKEIPVDRREVFERKKAEKEKPPC